ncbi:MAG: 2-oxoacid:acceptor oxidoreductase subunit alpha [Alphaproteobacteria bacterium]|nr:2-oxoacid:acceptor oxidoreductase subunit alpha [Alphaproteobacteria bacterium]
MPLDFPLSASFSLAIVGSGGAGVITTGGLLLNAAARAGGYGLLTRSVGPQIRGGEAAALIRLSSRPVDCHNDSFDLVIALDWQNVQRFAAELPLGPGSLILAEETAGDVPAPLLVAGSRAIKIPMQKLAKGIPGGRPNMVALGLAAELIGLPEDGLATIVTHALAHKGSEAAGASLKAIAAGRTQAAGIDRGARTFALAATPSAREHWIVTGNEATGLGALRGGIRFVAAYPITPATEILEWMAPALPKVNGMLIQAEDELASINMVIGAAFGGTPAMTATSGPGLALMIESLGLAVASETPILVVDVMRNGPSTGIPTKSEQSDLNISVHGLHGDAPHLVLAPLSVADCLFTTQWAAHLSEKLQTPTIVLSDQFMGQARAIVDCPESAVFDETRAVPPPGIADYKRYALTAHGISPMALPGAPGCQYTADGLEHNERGTPSSQAEDHRAQLDKRLRKLTDHDYGAAWAEIDGNGDIAVVTWGSSTGPAREAVARARAQGHAVRLIAVRLIAPAQPARLAESLAGARHVLVVEQNHSGQFFHYLRGHGALPAEARSLHRPGPLPLRPGEILSALPLGGQPA